jgi:AmmeMemoRadiSam system protein B
MSADQTENPNLRLIDAQPLVYEGESYLVLRDPLQLTEQSLLIPQPLIPALTLCDGTHTPAGMRATLAIRYGLFLSPDRIREFLDTLDNALLLENERSRRARAAAQVEFRQAAFRPPSSAGLSYPADPQELANYLDQFIRQTKTSDRENHQMLPHRHSESLPGGSSGDRGTLCGLISPHIDYERGGAVYAQIWGHAAQAVQQAELAIIFGTDHYSEGQPFSLTHQSYATPFGVLPTDTAIVEELEHAIGPEAAFAGELHHRREHSIELAAVWLHHVRGGQPITTVPILTGSLDAAHSRGSGHEVEAVLEVLTKAIRGRKTLVIAAGDLAHVGPAFDSDPVTPEKLIQLKAADDDLIGTICRGDAEGFYAAIQRVQDANNVCGVTPIYLTLRLLGPRRGENLAYAVCPADQNCTSVVTICGVSLHSD